MSVVGREVGSVVGVPEGVSTSPVACSSAVSTGTATIRDTGSLRHHPATSNTSASRDLASNIEGWEAQAPTSDEVSCT